MRGEDGRYHDIGPLIGLEEPMVSRGIATADVDGDGRLDFALANQWGPSWFFHNEAPKPGAFLGLHVLLPVDPSPADRIVARPGHPDRDLPGRPAIGAVASLKLPDGRILTGRVDGGTGHSGRRSPDIQLGLGNLGAGAKLNVELRWRDHTGKPQESTMMLTPGWHTVRLGAKPAQMAATKGAP